MRVITVITQDETLNTVWAVNPIVWGSILNYYGDIKEITLDNGLRILANDLSQHKQNDPAILYGDDGTEYRIAIKQVFY